MPPASARTMTRQPSQTSSGKCTRRLLLRVQISMFSLLVSKSNPGVDPLPGTTTSQQKLASLAGGEPIQQAMAFYEHRLAALMGLKLGMKVLDVGCGVGGHAREIAKFIGCEIVGITTNQCQVNRAIEETAQAGLSDKCICI